MQDYKPARKKPRTAKNSRRKSGGSSSTKRNFVSIKKRSGERKKPNKFVKLFFSLFLLALGLGLLFLISGMVLAHLFPVKTSKTIFLTSEAKNESAKNYLLNFDTKTNKTTLISLDSTNLKEVLGGYGDYKLGSIYSLLKIDNRDDEYINASLSLAVEAIVDEFIVADLKKDLMGKGDLEKILLNSAFEKAWNPNYFISTFSYYAFVKNSNFEALENKGNELSMQEKNVLQKSRGEVCPVAVLNTTTTQGLASKINQILINDGINVIRVDSDSSLNFEKTKIYADRSMQSCNQLLNRIRNIIPSHEIEENVEKTNQYRAGIVVLLGKDFVY